jgi:hypothetical protein
VAADGVFTAKVTTRQALADNGDRPPSCIVLGRECATPDQRDSQRFEVIGADEVVAGLWSVRRLHSGTSLDDEALATGELNGWPRRDRSGHHARNRARTIQDRVPEGHRFCKGPTSV